MRTILSVENLESRRMLSANSLVVKFLDGVNPDNYQMPDQMRIVSKIANLPIVKVELNGISTADGIRAMQESCTVEYAHENIQVSIAQTPNDPLFDQLYGMRNISAPLAWDVVTESPIVVGIIDTGIDYNHPDLNMWVNPDEIADNGIDDDGNGFIDDIHGWDFINNDNDPFDDHSHGTHVAGTVGAIGNNALGVAGVTWGVQVAALKFLGAGGGGTIFDAIAAIDYSITEEFPVTNNSWGGSGDPNGPEWRGLRDIIAAADNQLFVAAAGNANSNNDLGGSIKFLPSSFNLDNVLAVAATDANDNYASFSNFGPTTVDLAAPGVGTLSTVPRGGYGLKSGTSMATPHVAGAAALVLAQNPDFNTAQLKSALMDSVDPLAASSKQTVTNGRLNVFQALGADDPGNPNDPVLNDDQYALNQSEILIIGAENGLLSNDVNVNALRIVTYPTGGALISNRDGSFVYTPGLNTVNDSFTYTDITQDSGQIATVSLTVQETPKFANPDSYSVKVGETVSGNLVENDSQPGYVFDVLPSRPSFGSLEWDSNGDFTYTANAVGTEALLYRVVTVDGSLVDVGQFNISVTSNTPVANNDEYFVTFGDSVIVPSPGVLSNDTNGRGDVLLSIITERPTNGRVILNPDGGFVYLPGNDFQSDKFSYKAIDEFGEEDWADVILTKAQQETENLIGTLDIPEDDVDFGFDGLDFDGLDFDDLDIDSFLELNGLFV